MKLSNILSALRNYGLAGVIWRVVRRVAPRSELRRIDALSLVDGKVGLEIGGPSPAFARGGVFPAYPAAGRIDNCNFASATIWAEHPQGQTFRFNRRRAPGKQFTAEATDLAPVADGAYDFVLSSHMIEHCANPLRALHEWRRILKPGGALILVAPHKEGTFDHRRPLTAMDHIVDDYAQGVDEADPTHLAEVLELHDLDRDPDSGGAENFRARTLQWKDNRALHHHVFDTHLAAEMVTHAGFRLLRAERRGPMDILVVASKPGG
ncbi:MAG TPA: class I SAM-dependent methyltransferase [Caulobacteraceae bacterium]|jgi:SAM-dependent methyltransferase